MSADERTLHLSPDAVNVRVARHFARDVVVEWGLAELADDVQLGTSELVGNAVRHAGTELDIALRRTDTGAVLVAVRDGADPFDPGDPDHAPTDARGGRGLHIVSAIADDWGVVDEHPGKTVWFSLTVTDPRRGDAELVSLAHRRECATTKRPPGDGETTSVRADNRR